MTSREPGRIMMVRRSLGELPDIPVPAPYRVRWYQAGDEQKWLAIKAESDPFHRAEVAYFEDAYGGNRELLPQRQAYLLDGTGKAVGTVTGWFADVDGRHLGKVNWMLLLPEVQGRGLAKPFVSLICRRLVELGHEDGFLNTLTARVRAINLYRRFGFQPWIRSSADLDQWLGVGDDLQPPLNVNELCCW